MVQHHNVLTVPLSRPLTLLYNSTRHEENNGVTAMPCFANPQPEVEMTMQMALGSGVTIR